MMFEGLIKFFIIIIYRRNAVNSRRETWVYFLN